jgi:hypothetical protein
MPFSPEPSNYNELLAQMIARARPQMAPPPSGHPSVGGGGHGGGFGPMNRTENNTQTNVGINLRAIAEALGFDTRTVGEKEEGKRKQDKHILDMTKEAAEHFTVNVPKEQQEAMYATDWVQKMLKGYSVVPNPWIQQDKATGSFRFTPITEEVANIKKYGVSAPVIGAGFLGDKAANRLAKTHLDSTPKTLENVAAAGVEAERLAKERIEAGTQVKRSEANLRDKQAWEIGQTTPSKITLQQAHADYYTKVGNAAEGELNKDEKEVAKQMMQTHRLVVGKIIQGMHESGITADKRQALIHEYGGQTINFLNNVKNLFKGNPAYAFGDVANYNTTVQQDLIRMGLPQPAKLWGPPSLKSDTDEKATRSYLNTSLSILRLLGDKTPFPMYHQVLDNVTEIAKRINLDADVAPILNQMVEFGKRTKYEGTDYLQSIIQQRRIRDKKERPTQPVPSGVPFRG